MTPGTGQPNGNHVRLEGSDWLKTNDSVRLREANPADTLTISVFVRSKPGGPPLPDMDYYMKHPCGNRKVYSIEEFDELFGAAGTDLEAIETFAKMYTLTMIESNTIQRRVVLAGTIAQMENAFEVRMSIYQTSGETYRGYEGHLYLPTELKDIVVGIFGLDNRRIGKRVHDATPVPSGGPSQPIGAVPITPTYSVEQIVNFYNFPWDDDDGTFSNGQTIALLEFGGGYDFNTVSTFLEEQLNITYNDYSEVYPGISPLTLVDVNYGATNNPGQNLKNDVEVVSDIVIAASSAPGTNLVVYFAPDTLDGWVSVISSSIHSKTNACNILSISWGEWEDAVFWNQNALDSIEKAFRSAAALGITIFVASGDQGAECKINDGNNHVIYPASSQWVTACGGTRIQVNSDGTFLETTWNDSNGATGGGVSTLTQFGVPAYQLKYDCVATKADGSQPLSTLPGRGVPDIAGCVGAYLIPASLTDQKLFAPNQTPISGQMLIGTGTSSVAPLYAGLIALINAQYAQNMQGSAIQPMGFLNPDLYRLGHTLVFNDINDGANNAWQGATGYVSTVGWDACTGLGSINGGLLLDWLLPKSEGGFGI